MTRTRIVATLGPATNTSEKIRALIEAGVDVFRLNFSHGTHEFHGELIKGIRRIAGDRPIAILQDLCGPKLRLTRPVKGRPGEIVEIDLPPSVRKGDPVLLADGIMHLEVVDAKHSRMPTRAEATDVANAVLDGTDAVMLSEETAAGNYPIESVKVMDRILAEVEPLLTPRADLLSPDAADAIAQAACILSERVGARAIVVPTSTGFTAKKVASYRPR